MIRRVLVGISLLLLINFFISSSGSSVSPLDSAVPGMVVISKAAASAKGKNKKKAKQKKTFTSTRGEKEKMEVELVRTEPYPEFKDLSRKPLPPHGENGVLLYTPSGGFNNQLVMFLNTVHLARDWKRDVLVPPAARHHDFYSVYLNLPPEDVISMDHVIDLDYMSKVAGVRLIPLQEPLKEYLNRTYGEDLNENTTIENIEILERTDALIRASKAERNAVFKRGQESSKKTVIMYGRFYCHCFDVTYLYSSIRYSELLLSVARLFHETVLGFEYNAMHIRLGDKLKKMVKQKGKKVIKRDGFVERAMELFDPNVPLYIATDAPPSHPVIQEMREAFPNVILEWWNHVESSDSAELRASFEKFDALIHSDKLRMDMNGFVEQLLCIRATKFIGSHYSTFSKTIYFSRLSLDSSAPDLAKTLRQNPPALNSRLAELVTFEGRPLKLRDNEIELQFDETQSADLKSTHKLLFEEEEESQLESDEEQNTDEETP